MTKSEIQTEIETLKSAISELEKKLVEKTREETFDEKFLGCESFTIANYPNSIFYRKNGKILFEIEESIIWCDYRDVWSVFEKTYSMKYAEIQSLITSRLETSFKMNGLTPCAGLEPPSQLLETSFKMKRLTPSPLE
jgi:hypothetical protein